MIVRADWNSFMLVAATPISWIPPDQSRDFHFGGEQNFTSNAEAPAES